MIRPDYERYAEDLRIELADRVLRITLDNPDKLNANTDAMHWALSRIWDDIDADPDVAVVVLTGAGKRAFSAGGDPAQMKIARDNPAWWANTAREAKRILYGMLACDTPIVARLNGHAVGFGATLALACDLGVGVQGAKFGDPHHGVGLVCGDGGALLWPDRIGYARAKELLFTGRLIAMEDAAEMGLINYAVPRDQLDAKVDELVGEITRGPSRAIQMTKNAMNLRLRQAALATLEVGLANEMISAQTGDHLEAVNAMLEKRDPTFSGG
ncbi:MAG: enoyl-CoA hydratase/isomerase family protein [Deltaproteobacteria bacterium]|nr:enoyl-CoA hydratase/isomerase family protein [Deltaproteobacteria bacterium]